MLLPDNKLGLFLNHYTDYSANELTLNQASNTEPMGKDGMGGYFVNARMTFAEMCRKKMDAINDKESTRTMNGSLQTELNGSIQGKDWLEHTLEVLVNHPCTI